MRFCTPGLAPPDGYTTYIARFCDELFMEVGAATGECVNFCVQQLVDSTPHPLALPEPLPWLGMLIGLALIYMLYRLADHQRDEDE